METSDLIKQFIDLTENFDIEQSDIEMLKSYLYRKRDAIFSEFKPSFPFEIEDIENIDYFKYLVCKENKDLAKYSYFDILETLGWLCVFSPVKIKKSDDGEMIEDDYNCFLEVLDPSCDINQIKELIECLIYFRFIEYDGYNTIKINPKIAKLIFWHWGICRFSFENTLSINDDIKILIQDIVIDLVERPFLEKKFYSQEVIKILSNLFKLDREDTIQCYFFEQLTYNVDKQFDLLTKNNLVIWLNHYAKIFTNKSRLINCYKTIKYSVKEDEIIELSFFEKAKYYTSKQLIETVDALINEIEIV